MTDDNRFHDEDDEQAERRDDDKSEPEIPASVAFMEMMRQAAAKAAQNNPPPAAPLEPPIAPPSYVPRSRRREAPRSASDETPTPAPEQAVPPAHNRLLRRPPAAKDIEPPRAQTPPPIEVDPEAAAQREAQRIRRIKRRQAKRRHRAVGILGGIVRSAIVVIAAAGLMATIFTWWTPSGFLSNQVRQELSVAVATSVVTLEPTVLPTPNWLRKIGIVSGHRGPQGDPGAVCSDGLTEAEINFAVAQRVVQALRGRGYTVDLLDEFDPRLDNYQAATLVSIHANTCQDYGSEVVSGYLIAAAAARQTARGNDDILVDCIARHYQSMTSLERRSGVTKDMSDYHTFREIHPLTPAAIIELGFMLADRPVLTGKQEEMAQGITDGIICFLEPDSIQAEGELTPIAVTTPEVGV